MIDEFNPPGTGFARFSDDRKLRYRLARILTTQVEFEYIGRNFGRIRPRDGAPSSLLISEVRRVVFLMLNPSTADAFKLDPTVSKCVKFALRWEAHALEVVNLYAHRTPYPEDLDSVPATELGMGAEADEEILAACRGAYRVIAAWGNNGWRYGRGAYVRQLLRDHQIPVMRLGQTGDGSPKHPLARGKHLIPIDQEPAVWP